MNITNKFIAIVFLSLTALSLSAQEAMTYNPPITVEPFFGNRAHAYQLIFAKKLQSLPRLGFLGISNFQAEWGKPLINDFVHQGNLTYSIGGGFDVNAGFIWEPVTGISPSAGIMYTYANPELLIITNPRIDISKEPNADVLLLMEYMPQLTKKLKLYTRAQGLYGYNFSQESHTRSYLMLRAGVSIKDITVGLANDIDYFGPEKIRLNNFGGFVRIELF